MHLDDKILSRETYGIGDIILRQGEKGSHAYFIEKGRVEVYVGPHDNPKAKITTVGKNTVIGEMALIGDQIRSANVRAIEPTILVKVERHNFQKHLQTHNKFFRAILEILVERLQKSNTVLSDHTVESDSLTKSIHEMIERYGESLSVERRREMREEISPILNNLFAKLHKFSCDT